MTTAQKPHDYDFEDYLESQGGVYLPFPKVVRLIRQWEWCASICSALLAGIRPPANRVADLLRFEENLKAYLPAEIAADYPTIPSDLLGVENFDKQHPEEEKDEDD